MTPVSEGRRDSLPMARRPGPFPPIKTVALMVPGGSEGYIADADQTSVRAEAAEVFTIEINRRPNSEGSSVIVVADQGARP